MYFIQVYHDVVPKYRFSSPSVPSEVSRSRGDTSYLTVRLALTGPVGRQLGMTATYLFSSWTVHTAALAAGSTPLFPSWSATMTPINNTAEQLLMIKQK